MSNSKQNNRVCSQFSLMQLLICYGYTVYGRDDCPLGWCILNFGNNVWLRWNIVLCDDVLYYVHDCIYTYGMQFIIYACVCVVYLHVNQDNVLALSLLSVLLHLLCAIFNFNKEVRRVGIIVCLCVLTYSVTLSVGKITQQDIRWIYKFFNKSEPHDWQRVIRFW